MEAQYHSSNISQCQEATIVKKYERKMAMGLAGWMGAWG